MACAGNNAVRVAHLNHHNRKGGVIGGKALECKLGSHALLLAKLNKLVDICLELVRCLGVDDGSCGKIESLAELGDVCGITEQNDFCVAFL